MHLTRYITKIIKTSNYCCDMCNLCLYMDLETCSSLIRHKCNPLIKLCFDLFLCFILNEINIYFLCNLILCFNSFVLASLEIQDGQAQLYSTSAIMQVHNCYQHLEHNPYDIELEHSSFFFFYVKCFFIILRWQGNQFDWGLTVSQTYSFISY